MAARYTDGPVGAYLELATASPARIGARAGFCVTTMAVNSDQSLRGGRANWGFPKELSSLRWAAEGDRWSLRCDDRGLTIEARPRGPAVPVVAPVYCLQRREDGPVVVLGWLRGRARPARVDVDVEVEADTDAGPGHPLPVTGRHRGLFVVDLTLVVNPARRVGGS